MNEDFNLKEGSNPLGSVLFNWLDYKHSVRIIICVLVVLCFGLIISDFVYDRYGHFLIEEVPGFYAAYGFVMFSIIILGATCLRFLVSRKEDYYGDKAVDSEEHENKSLKEN